MANPVLVSSCLLGLPTRYDGTDNYSPAVQDYLQEKQLMPIPVCPEQLAGMPTPRPKCWFFRGDGYSVLTGDGAVGSEQGQDVTTAFSQAAKQTLKIAELTGCRLAILKQRSPSCGSRLVHQNGQVITGMGVTAAILKQAGIVVLSEDDLEEK